MSTSEPLECETARHDPYDAFLAAREEVMKLKWIASERSGHDVGIEVALLEWARAGAHEEKGTTGERE